MFVDGEKGEVGDASMFANGQEPPNLLSYAVFSTFKPTSFPQPMNAAQLALTLTTQAGNHMEMRSGDTEDDKQSACIQTLVAGNGKAYIELFYLTHLANVVSSFACLL